MVKNRHFGTWRNRENICQNGNVCLFSAKKERFDSEKLISPPLKMRTPTEISFAQNITMIQECVTIQEFPGKFCPLANCYKS